MKYVLLTFSVLLIGGLSVYTLKYIDHPFFHQSQTTPNDVGIPAASSAASTFSLRNIQVPSVLRVADRNPQLNDGDFLVTWETVGGENIDPESVFLSFAIVDETNVTVVSHLYGAGVGASFKAEQWHLSMPPLCGTEDDCFPAIEPTKKYRLEATATICADTHINPAYCSDADARAITPAYSNWFTVSE